MEGTADSARRRFLRRGALLVGGTLGLGVLSRSAPSLAGSQSADGAIAMSLKGKDWRLTSPDRRRGVLPDQGERSSSFGQLFEAAGQKVGEFYASSFTFGSPFGPTGTAAAAMEIHHFNLVDGTLVGMGTLSGFHDSKSMHAIIGGTGRYEGASGSYTARQSPVELGGDGTADFEFHITVRST